MTSNVETRLRPAFVSSMRKNWAKTVDASEAARREGDEEKMLALRHASRYLYDMACTNYRTTHVPLYRRMTK